MEHQNRTTSAALVYQGGLANVFETSRMIAGEVVHEKRRILQADFWSCEYFARGLQAAGVDVTSFQCNQAGDIINAPWSADLSSAPFSDKFRPVGEFKMGVK